LASSQRRGVASTTLARVRHHRGVSRAVILVLIPIAAASYAVRTLVLAVLGEKAPRVAAAVDASWAWVPLIAVLVVVTIANVAVGVLAAVAMLVFLTSSHAIGSPFRPRH
jgi:hypothetical protein